MLQIDALNIEVNFGGVMKWLEHTPK